MRTIYFFNFKLKNEIEKKIAANNNTISEKTGNWTFDSIWDSQFTSRGFNQVVVKTFIVLPTIDVCSVMENVNYNKK